MPIAAVPDYLKEADDSNATPEMRFGMLLPIWSVRWEKVKDKEAQKAWNKIKKLTTEDQKRMRALQQRQRAMESALGSGTCLTVEAKSIAPFTTGLGNEHPLENGFAFLNPYGLPYLPGSGVKGAVRRAAEELAGIAPGIRWEDESDWTEEAVTVMFGPAEGELQRGALSFWDVIPQVKGDKLMVEIMTPHQGHYYQDGKTPHDSGQPIPISFLTVPPGSGFSFHVVCNLTHLNRLAPGLVKEGKWKELLEAAFEHAFDWCGFGAKTAVGYGQMQVDLDRLEAEKAHRKEEHARQEEERRLADFSESARDFEMQSKGANWVTDKNAFSQAGVIENWLNKLEENMDEYVLRRLEELIDIHFKGLLQNPDKVKGKKKKPVFHNRQREIAKRLLKFKEQ